MKLLLLSHTVEDSTERSQLQKEMNRVIELEGLSKDPKYRKLVSFGLKLGIDLPQEYIDVLKNKEWNMHSDVFMRLAIKALADPRDSHFGSAISTEPGALTIANAHMSEVEQLYFGTAKAVKGIYGECVIDNMPLFPSLHGYVEKVKAIKAELKTSSTASISGRIATTRTSGTSAIAATAATTPTTVATSTSTRSPRTATHARRDDGVSGEHEQTRRIALV